MFCMVLVGNVNLDGYMEWKMTGATILTAFTLSLAIPNFIFLSPRPLYLLLSLLPRSFSLQPHVRSSKKLHSRHAKRQCDYRCFVWCVCVCVCGKRELS